MMPVIKCSRITAQTRPLRWAGMAVKGAAATSQAEQECLPQPATKSQPADGWSSDEAVEHDDSGSAPHGSQRSRDARQSSVSRSEHAASDVACAAGDAFASAADDEDDGAARAIVTACRAAHEDGKQQGWNAGYEQGLQEGLRQGREEAAASRSCKERLAAVAEAIGLASHNWQAELESAAIEIGYAALLRIVGQTAGDRAMVESMVRAVLEQLPERRLVSIHLAPADHALLHDGDGLPPSLGAVLLADERVSMGGCIVDTDAGSLDGRLETRLAELKALLLEVRHAQEVTQ